MIFTLIDAILPPSGKSKLLSVEHNGQASLAFTLPRQGISLLVLEWK
jgi:hypothetical protein